MKKRLFLFPEDQRADGLRSVAAQTAALDNRQEARHVDFWERVGHDTSRKGNGQLDQLPSIRSLFAFFLLLCSLLSPASSANTTTVDRVSHTPASCFVQSVRTQRRQEQNTFLSFQTISLQEELC